MQPTKPPATCPNLNDPLVKFIHKLDNNSKMRKALVDAAEKASKIPDSEPAKETCHPIVRKVVAARMAKLEKAMQGMTPEQQKHYLIEELMKKQA